MEELPEGYKRVDYLQRKSEKLYIVKGFKNEQSAVKFGERVAKNRYDIGAQMETRIKEYAVVIPESSIKYLNKRELKRTIPYQSDITIVPFIPSIYRFMGDKKYIDEFFENGKIRLSTFKRCANLENASRRDDTEGKNDVIGEVGAYTMKFGVGVSNAIILCTSLSRYYKNDKGIEENECVEILDVPSFALTISQALVKMGINVQNVLYGPCVYSDRKINGLGGKETVEKLANQINSGTNTFDFNLMFNATSEIAGPSVYFHKPLNKSNETEFRLVWVTENEPEEEYYDIVVPEARQFCRLTKINDVKGE